MESNHKRFDENTLLEKIFKQLDISQTDYEKAVESYNAVGKYLVEILGKTANIYPQGSFLYGTVIRPYFQGKDAEYDIDLVCEFIPSPDTAEACKTLVGNALKASERYKKMLKDEEGRRCWTLEYAKTGEADFHMDILPSKPASADRIKKLTDQGVPIEYANTAIQITTKIVDGYKWDYSNPKGFKAWLDDVTILYMKEIRVMHEDSVESVPSQYESQTPVHRVIQILKRHRDIRFDTAGLNDIKPMSMIITTLVTRVAEANTNKSVSVFELLEMVIRSADKVKTLSEQNMRYDAFEESFIKRKDNGEWEINNPVDPEENFAETWHKNNSEKAKAFFQWVDWLKQDLLIPLKSRDSVQAFKGLSDGLGKGFVKNVFDELKLPITAPTIHISKKEDIDTMPKPWKPDER